MKTAARTFAAVITVLLLAEAGYTTPLLCFSDLASGPKTGNTDVSLGQGSGTDGAIVTVWGKSLGSSQGASKIFVNGTEARVYSWKNATAPADLYTRHLMQMVEFQIVGQTPDNGSGITVTAGGVTSNALPFTIRAANIYFVKTTGNDGSGDGSWGKPWKSMSKGVNAMAAGGLVYVCDGVSATSDDGYSSAVNLDRHGSADKPFSILAYPGATVLVGTDSLRFGFGHWESGFGYSDHWTIAKFHITSGQISVPLRSGSRLAGNRVTAPTASAPEGAVEADGDSLFVLGNEITHTGKVGCSKLYHPLYVSSDRTDSGPRNPTEREREIAYNYFHDNNAIRAINVYSEQSSTAFMSHNKIHDNFIINQVSDGMLIGYYVTGENWVYNNVIVKAGLGPDPDPSESGASTHYGVQIDCGHEDTTTTLYFYNNTIYGCGWGQTSAGAGASGNVCITDLSRYTLKFNNNIIMSTGQPYIAGWSDADLSKVQGGNNLWYGAGAAPSWDLLPTTGNPAFVDTASGNMHLAAASSAINAGKDLSSVVPIDFDGVPRPQGAAFDIGAYEYYSGTPGMARMSIPAAKNLMLRTSFVSSGNPVRFDAPGTVTVYDQSGRRVACISAGHAWNLADLHGSRVPAGMYLFSAITGPDEKVCGNILVGR